MAPEVRGASLLALAEGVATRKWKARDLVEAYLDRIARLDRRLGAYLRVDAAGPDAAARSAGLVECLELIARLQDLPRLWRLAGLIGPRMSRRQLWSVLVPVEREVARR